MSYFWSVPQCSLLQTNIAKEDLHIALVRKKDLFLFRASPCILYIFEVRVLMLFFHICEQLWLKRASKREICSAHLIYIKFSATKQSKRNFGIIIT